MKCSHENEKEIIEYKIKGQFENKNIKIKKNSSEEMKSRQTGDFKFQVQFLTKMQKRRHVKQL